MLVDEVIDCQEREKGKEGGVSGMFVITQFYLTGIQFYLRL